MCSESICNINRSFLKQMLSVWTLLAAAICAGMTTFASYTLK